MISLIFIIFIATLLLFGIYKCTSLFKSASILKVECISMPSDGRRRDDLRNHLKMIDFTSCDFNFFTAITPSTLSDEYQMYKQHIKNNRLACWQSHVDIWKKYKDYKEPVMVVEDDVRFVKDFQSKLGYILDALKNIEWDMCFLGRNEIEDVCTNIPLKVCDLEVVKNNFFATHCYLINPNNLDRILQCDVVNMDLDRFKTTLKKENKHMAIDTCISHLMKQNKLNVIGVKNQLADQVSTPGGFYRIFNIFDGYGTNTS